MLLWLLSALLMWHTLPFDGVFYIFVLSFLIGRSLLVKFMENSTEMGLIL